MTQPHLIEDRLAEASRIIDYALRIRMYGERAPGGNENWRDFDRMAEGFLRAELDRLRA